MRDELKLATREVKASPAMLKLRGLTADLEMCKADLSKAQAEKTSLQAHSQEQARIKAELARQLEAQSGKVEAMTTEAKREAKREASRADAAERVASAESKRADVAVRSAASTNATLLEIEREKRELETVAERAAAAAARRVDALEQSRRRLTIGLGALSCLFFLFCVSLCFFTKTSISATASPPATSGVGLMALPGTGKELSHPYAQALQLVWKLANESDHFDGPVCDVETTDEARAIVAVLSQGGKGGQSTPEARWSPYGFIELLLWLALLTIVGVGSIVAV